MMMQIDQDFADRMVNDAVAFAAGQRFAGDRQQALAALRQGRCDVCDHLRYDLSRQVANALGQTDRTVKGVFAIDIGARQAAARRENAPIQGGINLIVWVERKSPALSALGATLETLLAKNRRRLACPHAVPACYVLQLHMIDDRDITEQRGFGALVDGSFLRSVAIWSRQDSRAESPSTGLASEALDQSLLTPFNPETASEELLLEQALLIESLPEERRRLLEARFLELKVALIRRLLSDQLGYIQVARHWFTVADLAEIRRRKIGGGKIGGKAAGLLLAAKILSALGDEELKAWIRIPASYYLGADLIYVYMTVNGLMHWNDQKYKTEEQMRLDYPLVQAEFQAGRFPPEILDQFTELLVAMGTQPLIVRSSSQLEDNFGTSFAGKYDSHFCANQGSPSQNLEALCQAITRTYASTLKPDALLYRRSKGLQDYDERMAVLIQPVQGRPQGQAGSPLARYYLPDLGGVAFSRNLYRWAPQIRREDGFARLVWGLGTRAVERGAADYPRLVALSHPLLLPDDSCDSIRRYSQQRVDLIDLQENCFKTLPIREALDPASPVLRYLVELEQDDFFTPLRSRPTQSDLPRLAFTFQELLRRTPVARRLRQLLRLLETNYHDTVDIEFTASLSRTLDAVNEIEITLLQCRPQAHLQSGEIPQLPVELPAERLILRTRFMVPRGYIPAVRYIIYVDPQAYFALPTPAERLGIARLVGKLNALLAGENFLCVGPGRWGTLNPDLGVTVGYADIHHASALIELSGPGIGMAPEPSLGTHFFQDLMEAQIYPLAVCLDQKDAYFNQAFFDGAPDCLAEFIPAEVSSRVVRLLRIGDYLPDASLELIMDDEAGEALAWLEPRN